MHHSVSGVLLIIAVLLGATSASGKKARLSGTFSIGNKVLPSTLDPYSLRLTPERCRGTMAVLVHLSVESPFAPDRIRELGGTILRTNGGNILISCPSQSVETIAALDGVLRCSVSSRPLPQMDSVLKQCRIAPIHGGPDVGGFSRSYTGRNVITGILDSEFDTRHPAFLDSNGQTRFFALWDQNDSTGRKNNRFGYGTIKNRNELLKDTTFGLSSEGEVHGTHTASTMAGSFSATGYTGVAPDAIIIGVCYRGSFEISEGLAWICSIADSLNLPCVINMSIGIANGPHDGTSPVDRMIDSLSGPGRIIVGAVGNDGGKYSHISFPLGFGETRKTWALPSVDSSITPASSYLGADFWGEPGKVFTGSFLVMDRRTFVYKESGSKFSTILSRVYGIDTIPWTNTDGSIDSFYLQYAVERSSQSNKKPHMLVVAYTTNPHLQLGISITNPSKSESMLLHGWNSMKESFHNFGLDGFEMGDSMYTVNEIGGTAKRNITVGAYCGRTQIPLWNNTLYPHENAALGDIFVSSGVGPTVDGRIKPDITAPGWSVIAALSRTAPKTWEEVAVWPDTSTLLSRYGGMTGTSMAAPVVAGIVALMLEAKPDLTPEEAKAILQETAVTDAFTGSLSTLSNKWGAGKADALGALTDILGEPAGLQLRAIPKRPSISLRYRSSTLVISSEKSFGTATTFTCSDLLGRTILIQQLKDQTSEFISLPLSKGVYIIRLFSEGAIQQTPPEILVVP